MARCLVVQHEEPEQAYAVADALVAAGVTLDVRRVFDDQSLPPDATGLDGLVVMGGPMSAASDDGFPTRGAELTLLGDALARGIPILGICLGAQLLAQASGGSVYPGPAGPEIGGGPVHLVAAARDDPLLGGLPDELTVLHWHGDTYHPPSGATQLATSPRYAQQAFRVGRCAWGLQFHVEVDHQAVAAFVAAFGDEATAAGVEPATIAVAGPVDDLAPARQRIAARFAALVAAHHRAQDLAPSR